MSSIIGKHIGGRTYYYLVRSERVDGKPRITEQRYLGTGEDIAEAVAGSAGAPRSTRHLRFGDVAATWSTLGRLGFVDTVEKLAPGRGMALALAVLHRATAPGLSLEQWWRDSAAARFVRPRVRADSVSDAEFWRLARRLSANRLAAIEQAHAARLLEHLGAGEPVTLAVDVPNFDLALLVTRDGAIPLVSYTEGTQARRGEPFEQTAALLAGRLGVRNHPTVVFDAEQRAGLHGRFLGALPIGEYPGLRTRPASARTPVDPSRFAGLTALDTRELVDGGNRRVVLTHSERLHAAQSRAFEKSLRTATRRLDGLRGRPREHIRAELARITRDRWVDRVLSTAVSGDSVEWRIDEFTRARVDEDYFGKQLLVTSHEDWSVAELVTAYRARYHLDGTFRMLQGPANPPWRWTPHRSAVHELIGVLAAGVVHLMRHEAAEHGIDLSARELLETLGGIGETVLKYRSTGGRPRTERLLTELDETARSLFELFELDRYAPRRP